MKQARETLTEMYFYFADNYVTIEKYAEHNGITVDQACTLLGLAKQVANLPTLMLEQI